MRDLTECSLLVRILVVSSPVVRNAAEMKKCGLESMCTELFQTQLK